jgi:folate-dependent phosphoribosylglycinamide formyltransferase PurN
MTRVVVLTGSELRHDFMRMAIALADGVEVVRSYCETTEGTVLDKAYESGSEIRISHLERRDRIENDFFGPFVRTAPDESNPVEVPRGDINGDQYYEEITELDPDLLVAYGCSIIRDPLLSAYEGRFLNVHLGLSPYYRGTGTNYWPLVNEEPEYVGATFMYLDEGVDTGDVIHQIRARVHRGDGPHQIGNRVIADVAETYAEIIRRFDDLEDVDHPAEVDEEDTRYYTSDDYSEDATRRLYENFDEGLIDEYLEERDERVAAVPILWNPALSGADTGTGMQ